MVQDSQNHIKPHKKIRVEEKHTPYEVSWENKEDPVLDSAKEIDPDEENLWKWVKTWMGFLLGVESLTQCQLRKQSKQKTHRGGGFVVLGGQTSVILLF